MSIPSPSPAERFAATLRWLTHAVVTRGLTGQLPQYLVSLIVDRLRGISQQFARIAARVGAGSYAPRRSGPRKTLPHQPRRPNPLPQSNGWLQTLVPDAPSARAQIEHLLRDPEMVALLAAAPRSLARPLRSLCRMLRVDPPPMPQPTPAAPRQAPAQPAARPTTPASPPPPARAGSPRRPSPPRACGPPRPA